MHVQAAGINSSQPEIDLELVNAIETISKSISLLIGMIVLNSRDSPQRSL